MLQCYIFVITCDGGGDWIIINFFFQNPKMMMEQQRGVKVEGNCDLIFEFSNSTFHPEILIEQQYKIVLCKVK